jgi:hypothetical protein
MRRVYGRWVMAVVFIQPSNVAEADTLLLLLRGSLQEPPTARTKQPHIYPPGGSHPAASAKSCRARAVRHRAIISRCMIHFRQRCRIGGVEFIQDGRNGGSRIQYVLIRLFYQLDRRFLHHAILRFNFFFKFLIDPSRTLLHLVIRLPPYTLRPTSRITFIPSVCCRDSTLPCFLSFCIMRRYSSSRLSFPSLKNWANLHPPSPHRSWTWTGIVCMQLTFTLSVHMFNRAFSIFVI